MLGLWHSWDESLPISGFGRFSKGAEVLAHPNRPDNGSHQNELALYWSHTCQPSSKTSRH